MKCVTPGLSRQGSHDARGPRRRDPERHRPVGPAACVERRSGTSALPSRPSAMILVDAGGLIVLVNSQTERLFGYGRDELIGARWRCSFPPKSTGPTSRPPGGRRPRSASGLAAGRTAARSRWRSAAIPSTPTRARWCPPRSRTSATHRLEEERRVLERRAGGAKLESLGVLAGGIAHRFNNLLVGVLGNASLAESRLPPDSPARPAAEKNIEKSAEQIADSAGNARVLRPGAFVIQPPICPRWLAEMRPLLEVSLGRGGADVRPGRRLPPGRGGRRPDPAVDRQPGRRTRRRHCRRGAAGVAADPDRGP